MFRDHIIPQKFNQISELIDVQTFRDNSHALKEMKRMADITQDKFHLDMIKHIYLANTFAELAKIMKNYVYDSHNYSETFGNDSARTFYYTGGMITNNLNFGYYAFHFRENLMDLMMERWYKTPTFQLE